MKPLDTPLAVGATADVHVWEDGFVLKLFHAGLPAAYAQFEARIARTVQNALREVDGLSVPAVGPLVRIGDRCGLVYQQVHGRSMLEVLRRHPQRLDTLGRQLAQLHLRLHSSVPVASAALRGLPTQRDRLHSKIQSAAGLSSRLRKAAGEALEMLADAPVQLCHGDFHPGNVLLAEGAVVIVDWRDASRGSAWADVARTCLLLRRGTAAASVTQTPGTALADPAIEAGRDQFHALYRERYLELCPVGGGRAAIEKWLPVVAAARLAEKVGASEQEALLSVVEAHFA